MSDDQAAPKNNSNPQNATRKPYNEQFAEMAESFCTNIIRDVPELHGIALVPIWEAKPENTTAGYLRLKNPDMPYLGSLLRLLGCLSAFNVEVHRDLVSQIRVFDDYAGQLGNKIQELTGQLQELNAQADTRDQTNTQQDAQK